MIPAIGMFSVACPSCESVLSARPDAQNCAGCGNRYLLRFGYLMPLDPDSATTALGAPA